MLPAFANSLPTLLADGTWDLFRPGVSTVSDSVDNLFLGITYVNIVFFVLIVGLMAIFIVKYRKRPGHKAEHSSHHNNALEAAWSLIPLLLVIAMFAYGFKGFLDMRIAPEDAFEIDVQAKKWAWAFTYPNGYVGPDLHVWKDQPFKLKLSSADVIHSLYIPAFRVKMDCVPGRYNTMWFEATEASTVGDANGNDKYDSGEDGFDLFCTEYCGTGHSSMIAKVVVYESRAEFDKWMKTAIDPRKQGMPVEVGEKLYKSRGCSQCHSIDGKDRPGNGGPSFKGHFGKMNAFTDGSEVKMDENYIRESILYPQKLIRKGYRPIMPTYLGQFNDDELFAIITYIKSLNGEAVTDWLPREGEEGGDSDGEEGASEEGAAAADDADAQPAEEAESAEEVQPTT